MISEHIVLEQLHKELGDVLGIATGEVLEKEDPFITLAVPYHSQWELDAGMTRSDCGPACVEMVCEYIEPELAGVSTDDIMKSITGGKNRGTTLTELTKAAFDLYGVRLGRVDAGTWDGLKLCIQDGLPVIVLVHYGSFPTRIDRNYTSGHFMVVVGFDEIDYQGVTIERIILHDPDFYGTALGMGAFVPVTRPVFGQMWGNCHLDENPDKVALVASV